MSDAFWITLLILIHCVSVTVTNREGEVIFTYTGLISATIDALVSRVERKRRK